MSKKHMNNKEFIKKFGPDIEVNENCLTDFACPECGSRSQFDIAVTMTATMCDDGSDDVSGDIEWEDESPITCGDCSHDGTVLDFTFDGLDQELEDLKAKTES